MKPHLLALLQDNCLDLLRCAFLRKLSGCVRNITGFCQLLLRLADTDISVKPKYRPIYRSVSIFKCLLTSHPIFLTKKKGKRLRELTDHFKLVGHYIPVNHRRSQGGLGAMPPQFSEHIVILCFERRHPK